MFLQNLKKPLILGRIFSLIYFTFDDQNNYLRYFQLIYSNIFVIIYSYSVYCSYVTYVEMFRQQQIVIKMYDLIIIVTGTLCSYLKFIWFFAKRNDLKLLLMDIDEFNTLRIKYSYVRSNNISYWNV